MTTPTLINHRDLAESRLAVQFKESPNLINYIRLLLRENDDLETVFQELFSERTLDTAVGVNLDVIGEIVGQERGFSQSVSQTFFGFAGAIGADTFGSSGAGNSATGSVFKSVSDIEFVDVTFDDDTYRIFIRSKISKNITRVTIDEVIDVVLQGVTSSSAVTVSETQASFKLTFAGTLSDDDKLLLARTTFTPRPAGVNATYADDDGVFS